MLFVGVGTIWQIGVLTNCSSALDILISGRVAVFQVIWNRQRDSGGDLLIAKRKTQSIVVYSSTSRIREALKNVFFRNSSKTDGPPQEDVFKCTKCTI